MEKEEIKYPICAYCGKEWNAEMLKLEVEEGGQGCETCGPEAADVSVEIKCPHCGKLVYKKEGKSYDF